MRERWTFSEPPGLILVAADMMAGWRPALAQLRCVSLALGIGDRGRAGSCTGDGARKSHPDPAPPAVSLCLENEKKVIDSWPHGRDYSPEHVPEVLSSPVALRFLTLLTS